MSGASGLASLTGSATAILIFLATSKKKKGIPAWEMDKAIFIMLLLFSILA